MSDKTVAQKLLIKPGYRLLFLNPPEAYDRLLGELPPGVTVSFEPAGPADLIQLFVRSRRELEDHLEGAKALLAPKGLLWISYPKCTSRIKADINRDSINDYAKTRGLEGIAMISIDDTWSALRLKLL